MYRSALPERRKAVGGLLLSLALTSFLTGVTEPIEFTFMFLAPVLYALHAIATGLAMVILHLLNVHLGFSFSAGLFDYILNFNRAQRPWLLIPIGLLYFGLYYGVFRICITRLNLATPGRETDELPVAPAPKTGSERAGSFIAALGGPSNLTEVAACTTRLRLLLKSNSAVDEPRLKSLGARGVLRTSEQGLQVVLGPIADQVAGEMRDALKSSVAASAPEGSALLKALGGRGNVASFELLAGRLVFSLEEPDQLDRAALEALNVRGVARSGERGVQVLVEDPDVWQKELSVLTSPA
jgi:PTS system N-acetylglucosamine-specific IIC component